MNKIYKVIYSKVRQCYVVVSEIAKSHGRNTKSSVAKSSAVLTAAVLIALGSLSIEGMPVAQADADAHNNDFIGANDYYWYWDEKDNKWEQNTYRDLMIGHLPRKTLPNNEGAGAKETGSIAAGLYAQAGMQTVTIGNRNAGQSRGSVFIGEHSGYNDKASNIPKGSENNYVTSVGFQSDATGWGSIAIGSNATAKNTERTDTSVTMTGNTDEDKKNGIYEIEKNPTIEGASVALGYSAQAQNGNIAIGSYSDATTQTKKTATAYTNKSVEASYVSVGNLTTQRRITNVADGADASDVATVGQLQTAFSDLSSAGWNLRTNDSSSSSTLIKSDMTVDLSPATDGTDNHKNLTISQGKSADGSTANVTIGLNREIVLGEKADGKGGSINVYSDSSDANNISNHVKITGSTISVNYPKSNSDNTTTDTRGVIIGVGEDKHGNPDGYIAFNNAGKSYTYLHTATEASDDLKDRLEYVGTSNDPKYIANLDDGTTFQGDFGTPAKVKLNQTIQVTGDLNNGITDTSKQKTENDLSDGNIGVVATKPTYNEDGSVNTPGKLTVKLAKDLNGITSISSQTATTTSGAKITLGNNGTTIEGGDVNVSNNKLTGLKEGDVKDGSTDAVTGNQLYAEQKAREEADTTITNSLSSLSDSAVKYDGADKATVTLAGTDGTTIKNLKDGELSDTSKDAVTGKQLYAEQTTRDTADTALSNRIGTLSDNGNYIQKDASVSTNLSTLDTHVKTNADAIAKETSDREAAITNITNNISGLSDSAVKYDGADKATVTLAGTDGTTIKNLKAGELSETSKDAVNGSQLYAEQTARNTADTALSDRIGTLSDNGNYIQKDASVSTNLSTLDTHVKTNADAIAKETSDREAAITNITNNLGDISTNKADINANNVTGENLKAWQTKLGDGSVASGNKGLVNGNTVYEALHGGLDDITIGHDDKDGQPGKDGSIGLVGQTGAKGKDGKNAYATTIIKTEKGAAGVNGKDGEDGITRIVYNDTNDPSKQQTVATLDDGMKFKGDGGTVIAKKLNSTLDIIGGATGTLSDGNIGVNSTADGKLKIQLAKDLTGMNSTTYTKKDGAGDSATTSTTVVDGNGLTIKSTVTKDGKTETVNGPSVTKDGIDAGNKQITNISNGIEKDSNGKYTITDQNKGNAANVSDVQNIVNDAKKDLTNGANGLNSKANVDASNIGENMKDAKGNKASAAEITKNKEAWASAISTDTVAKGNKQLVTSDAVATALDSKADKTYVDKQLDTKANKSDVYTKDQTYSKSEVDSKVSNITTGLDGKAGKDLDNISGKGQQVIHNIAKDAVEVVDGTNTTVTKTEGTNTTPTKYAVNVEGTGKVAAGDTGLISGDTLYKEVHIGKDGAYIKGSQSVGQNLSNLDTGLKTTSDLIHTNTKGDTIQIGGNSTATKIDISGKDKDGKSTGRVITGIVSDANDPNSAANVGYVNGITAASNQQIYNDMNMQYNHVENDISRAAAGSNALAALHPMQEFDPDDKAQFALGYGHYRNSNAGAVGAFYQPDENSMVNFGVSFGNGDAGINAGVTFKFGPGGSGHHALTKTQMAKVIDAQSKEIDELKKDNADKDKRIDALEQKMTEILAKLDKSKD